MSALNFLKEAVFSDEIARSRGFLQRLDPRIELWAGGAVWERVRKTMPGTRLLASVSDIPPALADWRQLHTAQAA